MSANKTTSKHRATLLVASRHHVKFHDENKNMLKGVLASRKMHAVIGDKVEYSLTSENKALIEKILPRKNCFKRSYGKKIKKLAANLDQLFLVTAPKPLFNTSVIDRILSAAQVESVECTIVINKCDLELSETKESIKYYEKLGITVLYTSTIDENGIKELKESIKTSEYKSAIFIGVSGVGKSSLLNRLCPEAAAQTGEVSERSGQGKQTTSMSKGYFYPKGDGREMLLIDLPGIQNFGVSHLNKEQLRESFIEFNTHKDSCKFSNCAHIEEPECAVLKELEVGAIAKSRYDSYLEMLAELELSY